MTSEIQTMDQGLLIRNPSLTPQQFSDHWFNRHTQLVIPFFLHSGMRDYEQIHGPLHPLTDNSDVINESTQEKLDLAIFSGAVGFPPIAAFTAFIDSLPKWKKDYYEEVILKDERGFMVSQALDHIVRVKPGSVRGERRVVIEGGKVLVEVSEAVMEVWRGYLVREGEMEGN